jgi:hypothetical protein
MDMKFNFPQSLKNYILQFAELYHHYKMANANVCAVRYRIHSTLADYQDMGTIQLAMTDKPGDFLPPVTLKEIKQMPDILSGMHPIDVNSINDLYYLSLDQVREIRVENDRIQAIGQDGNVTTYDVNETFDPRCSASKRIAFTMGYMQAEKMMHRAYMQQERYKVVQDNITTLQILDAEKNEHVLMSPLEILFSEQYKFFAKEDIARIGYICGQMSQLQSYTNDTIA